MVLIVPICSYSNGTLGDMLCFQLSLLMWLLLLLGMYAYLLLARSRVFVDCHLSNVEFFVGYFNISNS